MNDTVRAAALCEELGPMAGAALLVAASTLATLTLEREPHVLPASAEAGAFSGERAQAVRRELLAGGAAHPVGSPANDAVRERVIEALTRQGYAPAVETRWACGSYGTCAQTHNVIAAWPGTTQGAPVLVAAHYDSVGAGIGASDDGAGTAALLEIARALRQAPPLPRSVRFLLTDGEEGGLLGAHAYVAAHREPAAAVINLEARGTEGLATLFETGPNATDAIDALASHVSRPKTSSLFSAVYKLLPNDTDFTVLCRGPASGANLAFIEGAARYHTRLDDLSYGSVGSLQHEGETGLALVRAFASHRGAAPPPQPLVWFDWGSRMLIRWPAYLSLPMTAAGIVLLAWGVIRARAPWRGPQLGWALLAAVGAPVLSTLTASALGALLFATGRLPAPWIAHPGLALGAALAAAWAVTLAVCVRARTRDARDPWASYAAAWSVWGAMGMAVSWALPGASYLFTPPAVLAGVAAVAGSRASRPAAFMMAPFALVAALWVAAFRLSAVALGMMAIPLYGFFGGLCALPVAPLLPTSPRLCSRVVAAIGASGLALALGSFAVPPFSHDSPQRLNILYLQDDRAGARWLLEGKWAGFRYGTPAESMLRTAAFAPEPVAALPYWNATMQAAAAPDIRLRGPELVVLARERTGIRRTMRLLLRSQRGATNVTLAIPPQSALMSARVEGSPWQPQHPVFRRWLFGEWKVMMLLGVPPEGVEVDLELDSPEPVDAILVDRTPGLPPEGQRIARERPDWSQPTQDGDGTLVLVHAPI